MRGVSSSSLTVDSRGAKSRSCALSTEVEASLKTIVARSPLEGVAVVKGMWTWAKCGPLAHTFVIQGVWNYFQSGQNNLVDIKGGGTLSQGA